MLKIADSGLIIAALDERDEHHAWARRLLEAEPPPWLVCEPVMTEIAASVGDPEPVLQMLTAGDLEIGLEISAHASELLKLAKKYRDQNMDLADACVVRMSEIHKNATVYTVDKKDFSVYRRNGNRPITCVFPSG